MSAFSQKYTEKNPEYTDIILSVLIEIGDIAV